VVTPQIYIFVIIGLRVIQCQLNARGTHGGPISELDPGARPR